MNMITKWAAVIAVLFLAACSTGPQRPAQIQGDDYAYTRDYMRWMIGEKMVENDIVGMSIALVDDQKIIWAEGFGYADEKNKIKATPDTIYRVGSITKLFTATAAMQLAEQGKLDIDQPLQHYLPQFSINSRFGDAGPITARTIMTHHSGLPTDRVNQMWGDETAHFTDLTVALKDEYVAFPPNTVGSYSNLGFSLLGHMVETISGTSYAGYMGQRILDPVGMAHSYVAPNLHDDDRTSKGYFNQKEHKTPHLRDVPAGGLNSNVIDLARFARMTFAGGRSHGFQILQPDTLVQMQQFQDGDAPFDVNRSVGFGWFLDDSFGDRAGLVARHNGGTPMFSSELITLPKHKLAVVVLANSNTAAGVAGEIAEEALKLALETKTGIKVKEPAELIQDLPVLLEDLDRLTGAWSTPMGLVHVSRHGDRLKANFNGEHINLVRREDGYYHLHYKLFGLLPLKLGRLQRAGIGYQQIAGHEVATLYVDGRPRTVIAEKATPQPLSEAWEKNLGRYQSINAKGDVLLKNVVLRYEEGLLLMTLEVIVSPGEKEEQHTVVLQPITDSEAVIHGLGRGKGDTVRFVDRDGERLLSYSGFLLNRID